MKELIAELRAELPGLAVEELVRLAGMVYLANTITLAAASIADSIQAAGELDTEAFLMPIHGRDEYDDN